jgi:hypothetical protein
MKKELNRSTPTRPKQSAQEKAPTSSFTASAYWKFESTPLQQTVWSLAGIRVPTSRSRTFPRVLRAAAASAVGRDAHDAAIWRQWAIISLPGHIPVPHARDVVAVTRPRVL